MMPQKRGTEEKMRTYHLDALCRTADTKLGRNTGRYVTDGRSKGFAKRLGALLDQAEQIRDAGDLSCAFSFSQHLFFLAKRKEVEDGWGYFAEQEERFVPFWKGILTDADESLQAEVFPGFVDLLRQEEIPDEEKEDAAAFVFSKYSREPYVEPLLQLVTDVWHRQIIQGNNRAFGEPTGCWTAKLRLLRGESERSAATGLFFECNRRMAQTALDLFGKTEDIPLAYCVLKFFESWITGKNSLDPAAGERLQELEQTGPEPYRAFFSFVKESPEAVGQYDTWREKFPEDLWPLLTWSWYQHVLNNRRALADCTGNGDLILREADKGFWGDTMIRRVEKLDPVLRKTYPCQLLGLYYIAFDNQSRRVSRGREQYREIAEKLYQLGERTDLPGAKETQKAILLHLAEEMHRFPAFLEELQKRFPDLVEISKL